MPMMHPNFPTNKENKQRKNSIQVTKELEYKIEIATQTLDRNISFNNNCDKKTSIVLATYGVLLAILLTKEGLNEISGIITTCIATKTFCSTIYLLSLIAAASTSAVGLFKLINVLTAKTTEAPLGRNKEKSLIFFAGIKQNKSYNTYRQNFCKTTKTDLLNDLLEQIYINADIASTKYATYNTGLKFATSGFISLIFLLLIGINIY